MTTAERKRVAQERARRARAGRRPRSGRRATVHVPDPNTGKPTTSLPSMQQVCVDNRDAELVGDNEVVAAMLANGFPSDPRVLATGVAIIECENSKRRKGCNSIGACGAWQILGSAHPSCGPSCAEDFCKATRYANKLWRADKTWGDWDASRSCWEPLVDRYEEMIRSGDFGIEGINKTLPEQARDALSPLAEIVRFIARIFEPSFWLRVGKVILGAVAILIAVGLLGKAMFGTDTVGDRVSRVRSRRRQERTRRARQGSDTATAAQRARAAQEAREEAKTRGEQRRKERFFADVNKEDPPF